MTVKALPLAELVEDLSIYPRHALDEQYVAHLAESLRAGATFPPVVAEVTGKRLVDGWHRVRAYRRVLGAGGVIDVDLRRYRSDEDILLDAIGLNAAHGRKLDRIDQVRAVVLAEEAGIPRPRIAIALQITVERVDTLRIKIAYAPQAAASAITTPTAGHAPSGGPVTGTIKVALKRPMIHLAGQQLTAEQVTAHDRQGGTSFLLQVQQIREALHYDLMNRSDDRLMAALRELEAALHTYLAAAPQPAPVP